MIWYILHDITYIACFCHVLWVLCQYVHVIVIQIHGIWYIPQKTNNLQNYRFCIVVASRDFQKLNLYIFETYISSHIHQRFVLQFLRENTYILWLNTTYLISNVESFFCNNSFRFSSIFFSKFSQNYFKLLVQKLAYFLSKYCIKNQIKNNQNFNQKYSLKLLSKIVYYWHEIFTKFWYEK